jgi:starch synthase
MVQNIQGGKMEQKKPKTAVAEKAKDAHCECGKCPMCGAKKVEHKAESAPIHAATHKLEHVAEHKAAPKTEHKIDKPEKSVAHTVERATPPATERSEKESGEKLKVLFCISEAQPFAASGGLGEVGGSLPKALTGCDVRVIMPLYQTVSSEVRKNSKFLGSMEIDFAYRKEYLGVFEHESEGVTFYFIDNEKYFKRDFLYTYNDDGERFAFFSKAILDSMNITNFFPDILHANDWHTAGSIVYLNTSYADNKKYQKIRTLFTIHNINFQGRFDYVFMTDIMGINIKYKGLLDFSNSVNLLKAAIECADMVNTVSPSYAQEIKTPEFAMGLESCINANAHKLVGILNGINNKFYNPKKDKELFENYDVKSIQGKAVNKRGIQKLLQMQIDESIPVILYNGRLSKQKGIDLIIESIDDILSDRVQMVVMGNGERNYEHYFEHIEQKYQGKFKSMRYSVNLSKKLYAGADLVLMPSVFEPCGLCQMIASRYGTIPIIHETGGLKDSIRDFGCTNGGNGYTFKNLTRNDLVYSIKRGVQDFANGGAAWTAKQKACIEKNFGWDNAVKEYLALYKKVKKVKRSCPAEL